MQIIVGSYNYGAVKDLFLELEELLPSVVISHREFTPVTSLRDLSAGPDSDREVTQDKLLSALIDHVVAGAVFRSDMLPGIVPDEIDQFSLPDRYWVDEAAKSGAAGAGLTLLFHRGDEIMPIIRNLLLPPVLFAGAGIGGVENVTLGVIKALEVCDVCVYDALIPDGIIDFLPAVAEKIFVGKRSGRHYMKQGEINRLLVELGKSGKRVVRLKGGDPSVFGRLAEEVDTLQREGLSFRVLPGITTLNVAAAGSGLLPTRRGVNRGFSISTPRRAGSHDFVPLAVKEQKESINVYYMAANLVPEIVTTMRADGFPANWPISLVYDAGNWDETVVCGTLADIGAKISRPDLKKRPALVLTGKGAAESYLFQTNAPLEKQKIIGCGADRSFYPQVKTAVENFGGRVKFVGRESLARVKPDIFRSEYAAIIFFDKATLDEFCDRCGSGMLTDKVVVVVADPEAGLPAGPNSIAPVTLTDKLTKPVQVSAVEDIERAGLCLAGYFSNCKIESIGSHAIKMENYNGS